MALGLHESTHHPKGTEEIPIGVSGKAWDDGVIGSLMWGNTVGVFLIQDEVIAPVLQDKATALWYYTCAHHLQF